MAMPVSYHCAAATDVPPETLYRMLWLRLRVFVVEQRAAYPELDGRDIEPGAELMWASDGDEGAVHPAHPRGPDRDAHRAGCH